MDAQFFDELPEGMGFRGKHGKYADLFASIEKAYLYAKAEQRDKKVFRCTFSNKENVVRAQTAANAANKPGAGKFNAGFELPQGWRVATRTALVNGKPDGEYYLWVEVAKTA